MTNDGKHVQFERFLTLGECELNQPLPDDVFAYGGLGLPDGSRVINYIEQIAYTYQDGKLSQPFKFHSDGDQAQLADPSPIFPRWVLAFVSLFVLAVAAVCLLMRRNRARTA